MLLLIYLLSILDEVISINPVFIYENNIIEQNSYIIKKLPTIYDLICSINENLDDILSTSSDVRELSEKLSVYQSNKNMGYNTKVQEIQLGLTNLIQLKSHEISTNLCKFIIFYE